MKRFNRIFIFSDFHSEFRKNLTLINNFPDADIGVCAGDIGDSRSMIQTIRAVCAKFPQVVYVLGNHELYHSSFDQVREAMRSLSDLNNLHFLDNSECTINGQRFVGTTLWFRDAVKHKTNRLGDYVYIENAAEQIQAENIKALEYLEGAKLSLDDIVVTHHLPSIRSVHPKYAHYQMDHLFVCDMEDLIKRTNLKMWIHGHTHSGCDYQINQTRIRCNPVGYPGEDSDFKMDTIDISIRMSE